MSQLILTGLLTLDTRISVVSFLDDEKLEVISLLSKICLQAVGCFLAVFFYYSIM